MTVDKMSLDKMTVGKMSEDIMMVEEMSNVTVDKIAVY
jgi:hypothetical protein